jgi:predicted phage terminase large subunit-like protein
LRRRRTVRASLTEWARFIGFEPAPHHRLIIAEIEALLQADEYDTLLLFAPPGSAKSSYVSIALPCWYLATRPQASVLAASHSVSLAEKWGRRVRNFIAEHGVTLGIALAGDSQAAGRLALKSGGEYLAAGVGVGIAGFRADLGIIDDPIGSRDDAFSEIVRERTYDWFVNDFSARLKPGAKRVIMHTRWHLDDLAGRILEEAKRGRYRVRVLSLPAVAVDRDDPLGRAPGEYLWDEPKGYNYGAQLRRAQREVDAAEWSALYQQQPIQEEGEFFRRHWFRWYDEPPKHLQTYGASDYAVTAKGGDYTVHVVVGIDADDNMFVLDVWRKQTESHVWIEANLDLVAQYQPLAWGEEQGQILKSLGPFIDRRANERRIYCNRQQFLSVRDKPTRCRAFQARCSMGKVYLPRNALWLNDLLAELLSFPAGRHDDQVDAFSLIGRLLDEMIGGSAPKVEVKDEPDYRALEGYRFLEAEFDGEEDTWRTI